MKTVSNFGCIYEYYAYLQPNFEKLHDQVNVNSFITPFPSRGGGYERVDINSIMMFLKS